MIEAVGHNYLPEYFEAVEKLLAPQGILVMQTITTPESRYRANKHSADFINTIIFPGGCCPSLHAMLEAIEAKTTLHLERHDNINLHYAETLRRWRKRFNTQLPRVLELGFDDSFIRCVSTKKQKKNNKLNAVPQILISFVRCVALQSQMLELLLVLLRDRVRASNHEHPDLDVFACWQSVPDRRPRPGPDCELNALLKHGLFFEG